MKKILLPILLMLLLSVPNLSNAETTRYISLKDGSVIKGQVVSMADDVYTINTENLGTIYIGQDQVVSITSTPFANPATPTANVNSINIGGLGASGLGGQQVPDNMKKLQMDIMSNPQIMNDIQSLMNNEEIMQVISDENFMNDVMTFDPSKVENSEQMQKLMGNPEMKKLIQKIEGQLETQP